MESDSGDYFGMHLLFGDSTLSVMKERTGIRARLLIMYRLWSVW